MRITFQILLSFFVLASHVVADWNSGVTIEEISTRISIDIVDEGVNVTVNLSKDAVGLLNADKGDSAIEDQVDLFSLNAIAIKSEQKIDSKLIESSALSRHVFFPFTDTERPQQLEIIPAFKKIRTVGEQYMITVSHQGLPVIDHGVLTDAEILQLDWQDPWYSHFLNPKLKRDHNDPVMAFLYIEPQTLKSEIVIRVKEMAGWMDLGLRDETMIYPDEYSIIKQKVGQFLLEQSKISADGRELSPVLQRVDYIRMGAADIQTYQPQQTQRQVATLIGVSITHSIAGMPQKVLWPWTLFNQKIQRVAIRAYDLAGLFDSYVTPEYRVFEWENMLADVELPDLGRKPQAVPVENDSAEKIVQYYWLFGVFCFLLISWFGCRHISYRFRIIAQICLLFISVYMGYYLFKTGRIFAMATLNEQQAKPIVNQLLWNVYQAFESTQEEMIYDHLAYSVSGDLRENLYLQNRQAFVLQDGAQSKVSAIEIQQLTSISAGLDAEYVFDCEWLVTGDVIHWGHQHRRENLYRAKIKLSPADDSWKIIELESIGQQRIDTP